MVGGAGGRERSRGRAAPYPAGEGPVPGGEVHVEGADEVEVMTAEELDAFLATLGSVEEFGSAEDGPGGDGDEDEEDDEGLGFGLRRRLCLSGSMQHRARAELARRRKLKGGG